MEQKFQFTPLKAGMGDAAIEVEGSDDPLSRFFCTL